MNHVKQKQIINAISTLESQQDNFLHLTANENQLSNTARAFLSSPLSNRYYFGGGGENGFIDWNPFTVQGMPEIEELVTKAEDALKEMLLAKEVNLNCLSGVHAMMCIILSSTNPGDTVMSIKHEDGGHFATENILRTTGRKHIYAEFSKEKLDIDKTVQLFNRNKAQLLYLDISYYLEPLDISSIREGIEKSAKIVFDASHTLGLIMGHAFDNPLENGADIVCGNTHKTLPGPQKGLIAYKDKSLGRKSSSIINSGLYSSTHTHHLIALAITILEMKEYGKDYAKQIISNSQALGNYLSELGYDLRTTSDGTFSKNHQLHMFLDNLGDYRLLYKNLLQNNISTNFDNTISSRVFARLGVQNVTRLGMKEKEMKEIAQLIHKSLIGNNTQTKVIDFVSKYRDINYSFD